MTLRVLFASAAFGAFCLFLLTLPASSAAEVAMFLGIPAAIMQIIGSCWFRIFPLVTLASIIQIIGWFGIRYFVVAGLLSVFVSAAVSFARPTGIHSRSRALFISYAVVLFFLIRVYLHGRIQSLFFWMLIGVIVASIHAAQALHMEPKDRRLPVTISGFLALIGFYSLFGAVPAATISMGLLIISGFADTQRVSTLRAHIQRKLIKELVTQVRLNARFAVKLALVDARTIAGFRHTYRNQ